MNSQYVDLSMKVHLSLSIAMLVYRYSSVTLLLGVSGFSLAAADAEVRVRDVSHTSKIPANTNHVPDPAFGQVFYVSICSSMYV